MSECSIKVEGIGKKFCKSLQRSMFYGGLDILQSATGQMPSSSGLRKDEFWAVDDVSFELKQGETLGIIGENGCGKTTLLRMLNGIFMPDKGRITICGKVGALIQIGAGFHPMLSGRENIYVNGAILGMRKKEIDSKFDSIVDFADIGDFLESPVKHYSSGMFVRLGFAIAIHCEPDILLIDEILSVGDIKFQLKCSKFISETLLKRGCTIIFVSHNRYSVQDICQRALYLNHGKMMDIGETGAVMAHYLNDVQLSGAASRDAVVKSGDGDERKIKKIEFLNKDGQAVTAFQSGDEARIRIYYSFRERLNLPSVGITFLHADKRYNLVSSTDYIFNVHSGYDGLKMDDLQGDGYFEVSIHALYLPIGVYRVFTYLFAENNLNLVEKNENAGEVEIGWTDKSPKRSLVDLPHSWRVHSGGHGS